jgi:hypothetical protein
VSTDEPVGGPVPIAWREGIRTRAKELEELTAWLRQTNADPDASQLFDAINLHLRAARDSTRRRRRIFLGSAIERSISNLDAAEVNLLTVAPDAYVQSQLPTLVTFVAENLRSNEPRRVKLEQIAKRIAKGSERELTKDERRSVAVAVRAAYSTREREYFVFAASAILCTSRPFAWP